MGKQTRAMQDVEARMATIERRVAACEVAIDNQARVLVAIRDAVRKAIERASPTKKNDSD